MGVRTPLPPPPPPPLDRCMLFKNVSTPIRFVHFLYHDSNLSSLGHKLDHHLHVNTPHYKRSSKRKPLFGVSDKVRLNPTTDYPATETSYNTEILQVVILYSPDIEQQRRWTDCADAQAGLRLCCSHTTQSGFLATMSIIMRNYN